MNKLIGIIVTLFLWAYEVTVPLFFIIPLAFLIVTAVAVVRRIRERKKPSRVAVIFLSCGGLFALASAVMSLLSYFDLSLYLFGVGSSILCPVAIGLSALCLVIGAILLMKDMIRKHLVVTLAILLSLWLMVFACLLCIFGLTSTYERIDEDTVMETEMPWHNTTVTEYKIIFPGLMKEVEVTYVNTTN